MNSKFHQNNTLSASAIKHCKVSQSLTTEQTQDCVETVSFTPYTEISFKTNGPYLPEYVAVAVDLILQRTWRPISSNDSTTSICGCIEIGEYKFSWQLRENDNGFHTYAKNEADKNQTLVISIPNMNSHLRAFQNYP